mgnify:CR=1 FL=1
MILFYLYQLRFKNFKIHLEKDNLFMKGTVNIFDSEINLEVEGDFEIKEDNKILFIPGEIKIEKLKISKDIIVYTKDEFEELKKDKGSFCYKIINEGVKVYDA